MTRWNANIKGVDADVDNASAAMAALVAATTQAAMQDQVRSLLAHNAHTNLTASYDDAANRVTLGLPPKYKTVPGSGGRNIADAEAANTLNPSEWDLPHLWEQSVALGGLLTLTNVGTSYDGPRRGVLRSSS